VRVLAEPRRAGYRQPRPQLTCAIMAGSPSSEGVERRSDGRPVIAAALLPRREVHWYVRLPGRLVCRRVRESFAPLRFSP